jgi:hypothetical protein
VAFFSWLSGVRLAWQHAEHQVRVHSLASYRHGVGYPRSPGNSASRVTRSVGECRMSLWSAVVVSIYRMTSGNMSSTTSAVLPTARPSPPHRVLLPFVCEWQLLLRLISVLPLKGRLGSGRLSDREQLLIAALARSIASVTTESPPETAPCFRWVRRGEPRTVRRGRPGGSAAARGHGW